MSDAPPSAPAGPAPTAEPGGSVPGGSVPGGSVPGGRRRPRSRWRAAFFVLAGLTIVAGTCWALFGNRMLVVRSVTVTGTHLLSPAQVTAAADVPLGTPLLRVDVGAVTRSVEAIPQVASASVTRDWPDRLVIAVTERVPVMGVRMAGGGYDLVDQTGVIVRWTPALPAELPLLKTSLPGAALRGSAEVTTAADVLAELSPWLAGQVTAVRAAPVTEGTEQVTLDLRDGKTVQWGSPGGAAEKNRELAILLPGSAHLVDVSTPGTVVARLPGGGYPGARGFPLTCATTREQPAAWRVDHAASPPYCPYQSQGRQNSKSQPEGET
jgi:cell division protein FtsQ